MQETSIVVLDSLGVRELDKKEEQYLTHIWNRLMDLRRSHPDHQGDTPAAVRGRTSLERHTGVYRPTVRFTTEATGYMLMP